MPLETLSVCTLSHHHHNKSVTAFSPLPSVTAEGVEQFVPEHVLIHDGVPVLCHPPSPTHNQEPYDTLSVKSSQ